MQPLSQTNAGFWSRFLRVQHWILGLYVVALCTSMSGMEIFSSLAALGALVGVICLRPPDLRLPPLARPIAFLAAVMAASILFGQATWDEGLYDLSRLRFFLLYAGLFYHLKYFSGDGPWRRVLFWSAAVIGVYGLFQHFMPLDLVRPEGKKIFRFAIQEEKIGPLVIGTFNHHLTFSNIFLFFAALALGWGMAGRRWAYGLAALLFLDVLWTGSRTALLAVPVVICTIVGRHSLKRALIAIAVGVVGLAVVIGTNDGIRERVVRTLEGTDAQYNMGPRLRLWHANWEMFREHPLLGVGYNQNERMAAQYVDRLYPFQENFYGHAHSFPFQVLASMGVLGVLAFGYLWFCLFRLVWQVHRAALPGSRAYWESWAIGAAWVGFTIQGLTQWNFGDAEVLHAVVFFWAVLALHHDKICGAPPAKV